MTTSIAAIARALPVLAFAAIAELARRHQLFGWAWANEMPDMERIYSRTLLLYMGLMAYWVCTRPQFETLMPEGRRGHVAFALRYIVFAGAVGLLSPFFSQQALLEVEAFLFCVRLFGIAAVIVLFAGLNFVLRNLAYQATREKELSTKLYEQSTTDQLTGLPNKLLFHDRLTSALARSKRTSGVVAVFVIDLDGFKLVNDSFGQEVGDKVLREAAARFHNCVRRSDTVCRMASDEFVAFASDINHSRDVVTLCERLAAEMSNPIKVGEDQEIVLSISIGVSLSPNDGVECDELIENATRAMHRAKDRGKSQFALYQPELNHAAIHRLTLENELRQAIARDELTVFYQPKIDARTGVISGAEALVRWRHPRRGMVSPAEFIPVAEETRLIVPLDRLVLRKACQQARAWQSAGFAGLRLSANLSARQFQTQDLPAFIASTLAECQLAPQLLELEITESTLMHNTDASLKILAELKALGVMIAIDDFGTGYSSLGYLKRFHVDCLKIDRSLISDGEERSEDAAIAKAIVALGHTFGMEVTAEGVETEKQVEFLRRIGCDSLQGFFFSRPVEPAAFEKTLSAPTGMGSLVVATPGSATAPKA